jgi:hypothetical protein
MLRKRGVKRKRIKPRNPLMPLVRGKRAVVEASKRAYTRKTKHKRPAENGDGEAR